VTAGRWLAIIIAFVSLLGSGFVTWRLLKDRKDHYAREATLRAELTMMRTAIADFRKTNGRYPRTLNEALPKGLPVDPITTSATTWRVMTEDDVQPNSDFTTTATKTESYVIDVHSGARAPYSEW
jgi:hypothetical protein